MSSRHGRGKRAPVLHVSPSRSSDVPTGSTPPPPAAAPQLALSPHSHQVVARAQAELDRRLRGLDSDSDSAVTHDAVQPPVGTQAGLAASAPQLQAQSAVFSAPVPVSAEEEQAMLRQALALSMREQ